MIQWAVIGLNISAFLAMVATFVATSARETAEETPQGDSDLPPLDYTRFR